ncbi:sodium-coupled monocarboxylate transporter 2-like [Onthophagus taurus]|uniref:sodium-coupled monocarboxylate transporter 2-like n=1 Tax=Onthophagus taurus TaxID=166361 RepID=UPI0039BEC0F2
MVTISFQKIDYAIFILTLLLTFLVGAFYSIFKKQNTAEEYLHGGRSMNLFVVAFSIISGAISIQIITIPTEIYYYGINSFVGSIITSPLVGLTTYFLIFPVFYKLQLTSIYTYLELRFDRKVKLLSSFIFAVQIIVSFPIITYIPALIVSYVSNINVYVITYSLNSLCIIYTLFGGIKAVIWTDALQLLFMLICLFGAVLVGFVRLGIWNIFKTASDTERLKIVLDLDPTKRDTLWIAIGGCYFQILGLMGFGQGSIQKYLSLKKYSDVKWACSIAFVGIMLIFTLSAFSGIIPLHQYVYCDPLISKKIRKPDQLLTHYIMDPEIRFSGLAGLFVSGIISASLSTLSSGLNSVTATVYSDFLKPYLSKNVIEKYETICLKLLVLIFGILCISCAYMVKYLENNIFPVFVSFIALTNGPMAGLFIAGLFITKINAKGAFYGGLISLIFMGWLVITSQWYQMQGLVKFPTLPLYTNNCGITFENVSNVKHNQSQNENVSSIFKLPHFLFPVIGSCTVLILGFLISCFTKTENDENVPDEYLSPLAHCIRKKCNISSYKSVLDVREECDSK